MRSAFGLAFTWECSQADRVSDAAGRLRGGSRRRLAGHAQVLGLLLQRLRRRSLARFPGTGRWAHDAFPERVALIIACRFDGLPAGSRDRTSRFAARNARWPRARRALGMRFAHLRAPAQARART